MTKNILAFLVLMFPNMDIDLNYLKSKLCLVVLKVG